MKKQTAAVMSAVTLISSVNVPVLPAFAMENQEEVQEIIEQNEREQIVVPVAEDGVGEEVFEEAAEEATQDVIEVTEITNEEIKEGEMNEGTTEEVNQETGSEELTEDVKEEVITEESTEEVKQEEVVVEGQETEDVLIGTENLTESEGETKELETEIQAQEEVDIPDMVLREVINKALGRESELDHPITQSELKSLTWLNYTSWEEDNPKITNLTGLEYATNLTELFLIGNQISDLTPLEGLTNLTSLGLSDNQISDLTPLEGLINLTFVSLSNNQIINFSPIDHVNDVYAPNQVIYLKAQQINKDDTVTINNPLLGKIFEKSDGITVPTGSYDKENNQIVWENVTTHHLQFTFKSSDDEVNGVVVVPVEFIDGEVEEEIINILDTELQAVINEALGRSDNLTYPITKPEMEQITELAGSWRGITNLEGLEYATNLTDLDLSYNGISDLGPLSELTNLTSLDLSYNTDISDLGPLSNLINLTELYLGQKHGKISDLGPLSNLVNLKHLGLCGTQVSDLTPLSNLTELEGLFLGELGVGGNQISDITPLSNLTNLTSLSLGCNQISDISIISNLINLKDLSLNGNQIKDLTPLDTLQSLESLSVDLQEITLDPIYIQRGETVVIDNPLVGEWWKVKDDNYGTTIYDVGFNVENGQYDAEKNQFVWENVATHSLTFSFSNWGGNLTRRYQGYAGGTVTIPVIFYEVSDAFIEFTSSEIFNVIGGSGESDNPLVLEVVEGTELETLKSLLAKYSDYNLTVTKKVIKERATTAVESYLLTFTKGEEQVIFEVHVPITETNMINYLNSLIEQPGQQPENKPAEEKPITTTPTVTKPTTQQNVTSQHPQTGMSGFMGVIGAGALSLAAIITRRKKK